MRQTPLWPDRAEFMMKLFSNIRIQLACLAAFAFTGVASAAVDDWDYNDLLGFVYVESFPWVANDLGWIYMFSDSPSTWDDQWGYSQTIGWYWAGSFGTDQQWVYTYHIGEEGYLSGDQFRAGLRSEPVVVSRETDFPATVAGDPFGITEVQVVDGELLVDVSYSGGCGEHSFVLVMEATLRESLPPQARFHLIHNANGDTCEQLVTRRLSFNISNHLDAWAVDNDQVRIVINHGQDFGSAEVLVDLGDVAGDPFGITEVEVVDGELLVDVSYSGGCEEHSFVLEVEETLKESFPPQARLHLIHNANGDTCEQLVTKRLSFNISDHLDAWAVDNDQVRIVINYGQDFGSAEVLVDLAD